MSTTALQQIAAAANWHLRVNENFDSSSPAALYSRNPATTTGLTWGYLGGNFNGVSVANGTVALTASNTNYVVAHRTTGAVTAATTTTNWLNTSTYLQLYEIVAGASTVTSYDDKRQAFGDSAAGGSASWGSITGTLSTQTDLQAALDAKASPGIAQNSQSTAYTLVLADANKHILHPSADTTARIMTIPANSSVAYPIGTALTFVNQNAAGILTIAITTDTMRLAGAGTTGSRTLAANGMATALKITSTEWIISGTSLT
jgi:hypothetical protein